MLVSRTLLFCTHTHFSAAAAALPPAGLVGVSAASSAIYARIAPLLLGLVEFGDGLVERLRGFELFQLLTSMHSAATFGHFGFEI